VHPVHQAFHYQESEVRTVLLDNEPWFVASDVCVCLELGNMTMALSRIDQDDISSTEVVDSIGRRQRARIVNEAGLYELILGSRKSEARTFKRWVTHDVIPAIRKTGSYSLTQPQSVEDLIILQAQSMKEMRQQLNAVATQLQTHQHRIDNLDHIAVDGDAQQRLNKMIRRYAHQEGVTFQKAWRDFTDRFNTAYHTNLTARVENYREKHGLKELTRPQYLSMANELEDAIRVADKMLNQEAVEV
jgi:prophage antirepressor-like protein